MIVERNNLILEELYTNYTGFSNEIKAIENNNLEHKQIIDTYKKMDPFERI